MKKTDNLEELENLLIDLLKCSKDDLKDENGPDNIPNWDSITHMEMVSKIEDNFNIEFDVDEINEMETIGVIKKTLGKLILLYSSSIQNELVK